MTDSVINLPIIICGEIKHPEDNEYLEVNYVNGTVVRITKPSADDLRKIYDYSGPLHDIPVAKVSRYMSRFAREFMDKEHPLRKQAVEYSSLVSGYTKEMLNRDYSVISAYLSARYTSYETLESELGDHRILDQWVRRKIARVRAFPRGRALHVLVGNVPLTGIYSVFRSLLTKNQTVVKLPSRDLISTLYFIWGMLDVNKQGPDYCQRLNKSLSVLYVPNDSQELTDLIEASDIVCAWGKGESLKRIKERVSHSTPFLEFGPKRSYSLVFADECRHDEAAVRVAHDVSVYDQEACLSTQRLFVIGDYEQFLPCLRRWLDWQAKWLRRGKSNPDIESHLNRVKMEAAFRKWSVLDGADSQWRILVCDPLEVQEHPLGRTLYVHPINSPEELLPYLDEETQAVSVYPYESQRVEDLGSLFCAQGVSKLCEAGMSLYPREGFTHDALYALQYFVRLCYLDENMSYEYRYDEPEGAYWFLGESYGCPAEGWEEFVSLFPKLD